RGWSPCWRAGRCCAGCCARWKTQRPQPLLHLWLQVASSSAFFIQTRPQQSKGGGVSNIGRRAEDLHTDALT
ncbi:unnamed protein product, partial [Heterosigma akashiwo]